MNDEIGLECSVDGSEAGGLWRTKSGDAEDRTDKMVTGTWRLAVFKRAGQNRWAAGDSCCPLLMIFSCGWRGTRICSMGTSSKVPSA